MQHILHLLYYPSCDSNVKSDDNLVLEVSCQLLVMGKPEITCVEEKMLVAPY